MNMLPMTKIRELCLHAAGHARRNFDAVLDGSRFEARDRDGHVFQGHETLSDEILSGETIYLIEGGLDARGAAGAVKGSKGANEKPRGSARERGRLLCLKSLELEGEEDETKTPYRTPSVSSRASSSRGDSKGKAGQARLTPSQKALAIAQMGRTPASKEPLVERRLAEISADSQIVIPDSQDPFSQGLFSQQSFEPDHPAHVIPTPDTSSAQSHSLPRVKAAIFQAKPQMSRPDPYDIDTVLSDDEGERSDESNTNNSTNTKMASSSPLKKPLGPSPGKKSSQKSPSKAPIITNPSKIEEATIIHDSSSAEASEEEQDVRIIKKEPPSNEESPSRKTRVADIPTIHENPQHEDERQDEVIELSSDSDSEIEPSADMLEDDEAELPNIEFELFMQRERPPSLPPSPARVNRSPMQNSPKTDPVNIEPAYKEPPPSAQTSKRKRPLGKEPDPEEKKHRRKRLKKEATDAKKQRDREQKAAMLLGETEEKKLAALQEERKKLALERAHRRALELEIIVSSPIKREPSIDLGEEGDDEDSGLGSSAYGGDDASADAGVQLDGDDKNDSLSSKEAEDHPASTPAIVEAQLQQCVEERFSRILFDDWAFLESTLGKGSSCGRGYSPLDVHNRVHLDMMQRAQHPPLQPSGEREPGNARTKDRSEPPPSHRLGQAGVAGAPARSRSQRSEAPSPKEHRMREMRMREKRKKRTKARDKLRQERARKRERGQKANGRYHQEFRGLRVGAEKTRKQKRQQKGH
ncbi:hypothetical protein UCDDA912_g08219 [Diaporthe ampelina]|uniref:Uncharacterized protein n=1 Tax=Diaporthe ampelina TaxID=1214573 RepID=A0A0G2HUP2_9PEZI|nr:hypothetical protein UCDDA912_g08219 [Diaporthe ampelina]